jgi:hypothetical protein
MTRRNFACALTAAAIGPTLPAAAPELVLEAVYGAHLPAALRITFRALPRGEGIPQQSYYELRVYHGAGRMHRHFVNVLVRSGIQPVILGRLRFLIPFDSLDQRNQAWTSVNSDPQWTDLRNQVRLAELTIYHTRCTDPLAIRRDANG